MRTDNLTDQQANSDPARDASHANSESEAIGVLLRRTMVRLRDPARLRDAGLDGLMNLHERSNGR